MNFSDLDDASEHSIHTPAERAAAASRSNWVSVVVNLVSDFVVLFAGHHSRKGADIDHPYGHQRFETAASLALGVILLAVGVGMVWSALQKLQSPDTIATVHLSALWVAGAALVVGLGLIGNLAGYPLLDPIAALIVGLMVGRMGDMIVVDAHIEVDANLTVEAGHNIAVAARAAVMRRHRVLNLMTHVDPAHRPDLDHAPNHL